VKGPIPVMTRRSLLALTLGAAALAFAAAGCAEKLTEVDPQYAPEGTFSPDARIIVYPDVPQVVQIYTDNIPEGPDTSDVLLSETVVRATGPGAIQGAIVDGTTASGYQVLRRESNGGFRSIKDFTLTPLRRWIDSEFELYRFADDSPSGFSPATYVGRGVVGGAVTTNSPLTNPGQLGAATLDELVYTGLRTPYDTLITMSWQAVPGAAGYWLQIFQNTGNTDQSVRTGIPAPFATTSIREYFVAYVTAPADSYKIGRDPGEVLYRRPLLTGNEYLVRVSAVDPGGRMLATTYGDSQIQPGAGEYALYRLGAAKVQPTRRTP
jgi:hypothetical protein